MVCDEEEHTKEEMEKIKFSIKQLIRKLHVVEPVEHVMSIIGKRWVCVCELCKYVYSVCPVVHLPVGNVSIE